MTVYWAILSSTYQSTNGCGTELLNSAQARELKSVQLDAPAGAVRLLLHVPHANRYNTSAQVGNATTPESVFHHLCTEPGPRQRLVQRMLAAFQPTPLGICC